MKLNNKRLDLVWESISSLIRCILIKLSKWSQSYLYKFKHFWIFILPCYSINDLKILVLKQHDQVLKKFRNDIYLLKLASQELSYERFHDDFKENSLSAHDFHYLLSIFICRISNPKVDKAIDRSISNITFFIIFNFKLLKILKSKSKTIC